MRLLTVFSLVLFLISTGLAIAADKIVMIVREDPIGVEDNIVKERLEALGFEIELHSQNEAHPVDIAGADGVFVSESILSGNVGGAYEGISIPFITSEAWLLDEMQIAPDNHTHEDPNQTSVTIVDPGHPMAAGLEGEIEIAPAPVWIMSTCEPAGDVQIVAKATVNDCVCLAGYEEGAEKMDGLKVKARRVLTFITRNSALVMTDDGWKLFDNSVLWGMGKLGAPVMPRGAVAATWGALKAYYH